MHSLRRCIKFYALCVLNNWNNLYAFGFRSKLLWFVYLILYTPSYHWFNIERMHSFSIFFSFYNFQAWRLHSKKLTNVIFLSSGMSKFKDQFQHRRSERAIFIYVCTYFILRITFINPQCLFFAYNFQTHDFHSDFPQFFHFNPSISRVVNRRKHSRWSNTCFWLMFEDLTWSWQSYPTMTTGTKVFLTQRTLFRFFWHKRYSLFDFINLWSDGSNLCKSNQV